jgi:hypothetical protein
LKIKLLKQSGTISQTNLAKYGSAAVEFLRCIYKYNPTAYYCERIDKLDKMIEDMPLQIKIAIRKWVKNYSGYFEGGGLANVEAWAYYGTKTFGLKTYSTDKRFMKLIGESVDFKKIGVSDDEGEINIELIRKELPKAIFFRPVGYNGRITIEYKDVSDIMSQSSGDYNKRQFRIKMFVEQ